MKSTVKADAVREALVELFVEADEKLHFFLSATHKHRNKEGEKEKCPLPHHLALVESHQLLRHILLHPLRQCQVCVRLLCLSLPQCECCSRVPLALP